MNWVNLNFPDSVFAESHKRNSFYEDQEEDERIKAQGLLLSPYFGKDEGDVD